jgi:hypothetical protein
VTLHSVATLSCCFRWWHWMMLSTWPFYWIACSWVFCSTFFMLFLASTNDRNQTLTPPNNIKLRRHSILYCFAYDDSNLLIMLLMSPKNLRLLILVFVYVFLWPMMNNMFAIELMVAKCWWTLTCEGVVFVAVEIRHRRRPPFRAIHQLHCP